MIADEGMCYPNHITNFRIRADYSYSGHRLKSEKNKAAQAIRSLKTQRRVILSGTPLQNDLHEFFIMIDFVNPGLLDTYANFRRTFEAPIVRSRQPEASAKDIEKGNARGDEVNKKCPIHLQLGHADKHSLH